MPKNSAQDAARTLLQDFKDHLNAVAEAHEAAHRAVEYREQCDERRATQIEQRRPRAANDGK